MSKPRSGPKTKPLTYEQAIAELPAAEKAMRAESAEYSQAYEQSVRELRKLHDVMARERARSILAHRRYDELRKVVDKGEPDLKRMIDSRLADDPSVTKGLLEAVANGEVETQHKERKNTPHNMVILIGGLARVKTKSEAQILAAIRYGNLFDRAQIGGARATDYTQVKVDTSGPKQDQISAAQDDARAELADARKALGPRATGIIDMVVIGGASVRSLAAKLGHGEGGQGRKRAEKELLDGIDVLVTCFKLDPAAKSRTHHWGDGSKAKILRDEEGNLIKMDEVA
ncbi:hypothetical protein [Pelagibacterium mangrovi]|uniref:hypothetical protein n=1 Tax=Pelagibacterium mangrovi TaxID=3119828 RepID=UPI002FC842C3